ncbi:MAG TPA: C25 family cysteine peptidase [Tenuifilaceae bacterium]|nr:C25 family cysteine peptidase [Tenuifilaceae bacterium]HPI44436.1 C25 family cysteine peptidase [Tenuifilaceae bacterium]HPN20459.1 C25 family cysteine peptidase [Tenuifilaceae bacterium]
MLKRIFTIVLFSLAVMSLNAQMGEIRLKTKQDVKPARLEKTISSDKFHLTVNLEKLTWKQSKQKDGEDYTLIWFDKSNSSGEVGTPQLPAYKKLILLPLGASVNARIVNSSETELSLKDYGVTKPIIPVQPSVRKDKDSLQVPFMRKKEIYAKQTYIKNPTVSVEILGNMRFYTIARLVVSPVDYNPVEGKIKVYNDIDIEVDVIGGAKTTNEIPGLSSPYFELLSKSVLNTTSTIYDSNPDKTKYPVKMLIISNRMFETSLAPFVQWKTQKGFKVITAYTDIIGTSSAQIKSYIQQQYNSATADDPAPTFLVFVGDVEQVPSSGEGSQSKKQTDLYYASVDGDMFPEMYFGRLSATTTQQLDNIVNKILYYEKYQFASPEYLNKVTLIAGEDGTWNSRVGQPTIKYGTANYFNSSKGFSVVNEYGVTSDPNNPLAQPSYENCYNPEKIAVGFMNYTAHCSETSWQDPALYISSVNAFTNTDNYPFTVANCCLSADFGTNECIGETWLRGANKGAVTYIGSSPSSYWKEDMYWAVGAFPMVGDNNGYVPTFAESTIGAYDAPFVSNYKTAGAMVFAGNLAVTEADLKDYPQQINPQYYWEAYNILGDPSLMPYFTEAAQNEISYDQTIIVGSSSFSVSAQEGTYVAITKGLEIIGTLYFNQTGERSVPIIGLEIPGELIITATRAQSIPHIGTINAVVASGPYVTLNSITVNDAQGNSNGKIDFDETVMVDLAVKNLGVAKSTNTRVLIENKTGFATLSSPDSVFIGDVNFEKDNNIVVVNDAFKFNIASNVPDKTTEKFTLTFKSNEGQWTSNLNLRINAPAITFGDFKIDDSKTGNNNSAANFGETFYGIVAIKNTGNSILDDLSVVFSIPDSVSDQIILSTEPLNNFSVDPGETVNLQVKVSVKPNSKYSYTYPLLVNVSSASYNLLNQEKVVFLDVTSENVILMKNQSVSTCSSLFFDSGGAVGGYADNESSVTTIASSIDYGKVKVSFEEFSLENTFDFLYVYDGSGTSSKQVAGSPFSGTNIPADITSSGNSLTFKFTSDGSNTSTGWRAAIECVEPSAIPVCVTNPYPANNSTNLFPNKLTWAPSDNAQFYDVYLGNATDNLAYLGRVVEPVKNVVLERNKDYYWKVTPGNYLGICSESCDVWYFKTSNLSGDVLMSNNEITVVDSVWFYDSGGSASNYQNGENYTLTFKPLSSGAKIKVEFINFDIETYTNCGYDYLKIFDGSTTSATLLNKYCGTTNPPSFTSTSANGELTFQFYSDGGINNAGWKAKITSVNTQTLYTLSVNVGDGGLPVKGASVSIDGLVKITGTDGVVQFSLPQGTFSYSVNSAGFNPLDGSVTKTASSQTINLDLGKAYKSTITVLDNLSNQPILGAKIAINGGEYFTTPMGVANVTTKLGENSLTIEKSGYNILSSNVTVATNDENFEFKITPQEYTLSVSVKDIYGVAVSSALVSVNSNTVLTNPEGFATIDVPRGVSQLEITNTKFLAHKQWINIDGNSTINVYMDYLQSEQRDVVFEIYGKTPVGVVPISLAKFTLFRNGEPILSTFSTSEGRVKTRQIEGNYDYSIEKEGYPSKDKVGISIGTESLIIKDTLINDTFEVVFAVKRNGNALSGANVTINGYGTQVTDVNGIAIFAAVGYTKGLSYSVSKDGYQTYGGSVDVTANKTINVNLILNGIEDLDEDNLVMYPNPANELVSVKLNSPVSLIQIFSITGILTKQIRPESNAVSEIPISDLTRGTYIVVVKLNNGKVLHTKLIKI